MRRRAAAPRRDFGRARVRHPRSHPGTKSSRPGGFYLGNGDPTAALKTGPKDKDGNATIPDGLTTPSAWYVRPWAQRVAMTPGRPPAPATLLGLAVCRRLAPQERAFRNGAMALPAAGSPSLRWAVGYSFVFHSGNPSRALGFSVPQGCRLRTQHGLLLLGFPECVFHVSADVHTCHPAPHRRRNRGTLRNSPPSSCSHILWMFVVLFPHQAHMIFGALTACR